MDALTYSDYLALDQVLSAQHPRSDEHDELLFIVVHQVYELWFKELLHEIDRLQQLFSAADSGRAQHTLRRILTILKVAVAQVDVLETMTPREFTGFRPRLEAASGFQSAQFRQLEAALGRRDPAMVAPYPPASAERRAIEGRMQSRSLFDGFLAFLAARGHVRAGSVEDLLVDVYRADGSEAQVAERLVDLDEGLQEWRYRHVKMVERTIGDKTGTGGSSGAGYLRDTLFRPLFPELWAVRRRL